MQLAPPPDYIAHRVALFEKLKAEYDAVVAGWRAKRFLLELD